MIFVSVTWFVLVVYKNMNNMNNYLLVHVLSFLCFKVTGLNISSIPRGNSHKLDEDDYNYNPPDKDYESGVSDPLSITIPENRLLDFVGLSEKYGFKATEYDVVTEDGYILKLFNIPGDKSRPVFLLHGMAGTADDYLLRGRRSLGIMLAEAGYDVWAGNVRGNTYSRRHVKLNPDIDDIFWNFSIDEQGLYDLPCMIDFVLDNTGQEKLSAVGFSQGTTAFFILSAGKPEYNNKLNVFISLASICYVHEFGEPLLTIASLLPRFGPHELDGFNTPFKKPMDMICSANQIFQYICNSLGDTVIDLMTGNDDSELEVGFEFIIYGHFPGGTSTIIMNHYHQMIISRRFQRYNFGAVENLIRYKSATVPEYDMTKATMNIAIIYGNNDRVGTRAIAESLKEKMPNVVFFKEVEWENWAHFDFVYGKRANKFVYEDVLNILEQYST